MRPSPEDDLVIERCFAAVVREKCDAALADLIARGGIRYTDRGLRKDFETGFRIGFRKHFETGFRQGCDKASRSIAIQMLKMGFPPGQVAQVTMLSREDVARLDLELRRDDRLADHLDG